MGERKEEKTKSSQSRLVTFGKSHSWPLAGTITEAWPVTSDPEPETWPAEPRRLTDKQSHPFVVVWHLSGLQSITLHIHRQRKLQPSTQYNVMQENYTVKYLSKPKYLTVLFLATFDQPWVILDKFAVIWIHFRLLLELKW